jgi:hypothetical protein
MKAAARPASRPVEQARDPVWTELLDFKNTADRWLAAARDIFADSGTQEGLAELATSTIDLGDDLAPYVQVWVEYDVVTNVEHPIASERGEPIRHTHGVEQTIGSPAARRSRTRSGPASSDDNNAPAPGPTEGARILADLISTTSCSHPPIWARSRR